MQGLSPGDLLSRLARLGVPHDARLGLALSGGVDSMALCALAAAAGLRPVAFTVNHGLRHNSEQEAELVGQWVARRGIEHRVLQLTWPSGVPTSRVQEQARDNRFRLLGEACRKEGIGQLMFAHQLDDAVETSIFRLFRSSGLDGLAGVRAVSPLPSAGYQDINVIRPLLDVPKSRLYATCRDLRMSWVDDPSNNSEHYQRNVVRRVLEDLAARHREISTSSLTEFLDIMNEHRDITESQVHALIRSNATIDEAGRFAVVRPLRKEEHAPPTFIRKRAFHIVVRWAGGSEHALRSSVVDRSWGALVASRTHAAPRVPVSAGRCHVVPLRGNTWVVARAPPVRSNAEEALQNVTFDASLSVLWDKRFIVKIIRCETIEGPHRCEPKPAAVPAWSEAHNGDMADWAEAAAEGNVRHEELAVWSLARYLSKCLDDVRRPALSGIPVVVHVPSMTAIACPSFGWTDIPAAQLRVVAESTWRSPLMLTPASDPDDEQAS